VKYKILHFPKHEKDCLFKEKQKPADEVVPVTLENLGEGLTQIEKQLEQGLVTEMKLEADFKIAKATATNNPFEPLHKIGELKAKYPELFQINMNGKALMPAEIYAFIPYTEWVKCGKLTLGMNTGAAKAGIKWNVTPEDIQKFEDEGVDKSIVDISVEVGTITELNTAMPQITTLVNQGYVVKVIGTDYLQVNQSQQPIVVNFGTLQKQFPGQIIVEFPNNAHSFCPNNSSQNALTYATALKWNLQKLGPNPQGVKWKIPANEWPLFQALGYEQSTFEMGPVVNQITIEFGNNTELQEAQNAVNLFAPVYQTINLKTTGSFSAGNTEMKILETMLTTGPHAGKTQMVSGVGQIALLSDSVHLEYATTAYKLGQANALAATTHAGGKHFYLKNSSIASRDSMPANQVFTVAQRNSSQLKLTNEVPGTIYIDNDWDVGNLSLYTNGWHKDIYAFPTTRTNHPTTGGVQPHNEWHPVNVGDQFAKHNEMTADNGQVIPAGSGVNFKIKTPVIFYCDYGYPSELTYSNKGLDVNTLNYSDNNNNNNSAPKILLGMEKMRKQTQYNIAPQKKLPARDIPVNVSTDNPAFTIGEGSNKKVILNFSELDILSSVGSENFLGGKELLVNNYVVYFDDQAMSAYYNYHVQNDMGEKFWSDRLIKLNNTEIVLFGQLQAGKQGFEWRETGGGGKSGR